MPAVTSQRRTLYHSELRELGTIVVEFSVKPRPSKFAGRPPYANIVIDGVDREYQCETPEIAEQLKDVPLRTPLRITALGSKEGAHLEVEQAADQSFGADTLVPTTTTRAVAQNRVQVPAPAPAAPTLSGSYFDCLEVAVVMVEAFRKRHGREPSECERAIACSVWIEQNRSNGSKPLTRGAQ